MIRTSIFTYNRSFPVRSVLLLSVYQYNSFLSNHDLTAINNIQTMGGLSNLATLQVEILILHYAL